MKKMSIKIGIIVIVSVIMLSGFYLSHAYVYNSQEETNDSSLILADETFSINYKDGNYFETNYLGNKDSLIRHLTITNVSTSPTYVSISLMDINKRNDKMEVKLVDKDGTIVYQDYLGNMDTEILKTKEIGIKETLTYDIVITNLGNDDTYGMSANIMAYKEIRKKEQKTFKDTILETNELKKDVEGDYLNNFTDSGLFMSEDDDGLSYVFRGNITDNYVSLNDILFRILRINGDGTVRLISNNNVITSAFRNKIDNEDYGNNALLSKSTALEKLNNWYSSNLSTIDSYIVNSKFCNENAYYLENIDGKFFNSYQRIVNDNTPSLKCSGLVEESKVGLINIDEVRYTGSSSNTTYDNYYLNNKEDNVGFYTLSGSQVVYNYNVVDNFSVTTEGKVVADSKVTSNLGLKPVISLDKNVIVDGNGTLETPYKLASK